MVKDEKTILDAEETVPDSDETVLDTEAADATLPDDDGATLPDDATVLDDEVASNGGSNAPVIEKGASLLDTYRIESDAIEGGMGAVWRVHHTGWNVDLAMKRPKAGMFQTEKQKENFIRECDAWINLGLHPHIVSCYYVRKIGDTPTIFSEWMDGGSLKNAINDGRLYEGNAAERILDIAIQFARGLHYAHEYRDEDGNPKGLIHQDVKPDNLLLTKDWDAKVADFGIARARATLTVLDADIPTDATMFSASGGYTPAYCSMEQMNGEQLTRRTDIYSWAVSVMEMYLGERPWQNGVIAGAACEEYFPDAKVTIPQKMQELLKKCLDVRETERPHDFAEVEKRLLEIYREETKEEYPRPVSKAAADTADSLNNRALSFLDLGKPDEAERCWELALQIEANHADAKYNQSLHLWRNAQIDDLDAVQRMEIIQNNSNTWRSKYLIALLHLERAQYSSAASLLKGILAESSADAGVEAAYQKAVLCDRSSPFFSLEKRSSSWGISSLSATKDGNILISDNGGDLQLWNLKDMLLLRDISIGHTTVNSAMISADGALAVTGDVGNLVKLWDMKTGQLIHSLEGHDAEVNAVCFSPDGRFAFSGDIYGGIIMWNVGERKQISRLSDDSGRIEVLRCTPDGKHMISGGAYGELSFWDIQTHRCCKVLKEGKSGIRAIDISPDGRYLLSGGNSEIVRLRDLRDDSIIQEFHLRDTDAWAVCLSPDNRFAMAGCTDQTIHMFDTVSGRCRHTFTGHNRQITALLVDKSGRLISGSEDSFIHVWEMPYFSYSAEWIITRVTAAVHRLADEEKIRCAMERIQVDMSRGDVGGALKLLRQTDAVPGFSGSAARHALNAQIGRYCIVSGIKSYWKGSTFRHKGIALSVDISPDGRLAAAADETGVVRVWDLASGKCSKEFACNGYVYAVRFYPDGKHVVSGGMDRTVRIWDVESGQCVHTFKGHDHSVSALCLSPDERLLFSASADKTIKIWDIGSEKCLHTLEGHIAEINALHISPDGKMLLSGSSISFNPYIDTGTLKLWDVDSGECIRTFGSDSIYAVCFCDSGSSALVSNSNNLIDKWDITTGEIIRSFTGLDETARCISLSPDARYLLSGDCGGKVKLWDYAAGTCLQTIDACVGRVTDITFSADGRSFAYSCDDNAVDLWHIDYAYEFPGWADWNEGALPCLQRFLSFHPAWTDADFNYLISQLQNCGYGWLRPGGIRKKLTELSPRKKGFFSLFGKKK